MTLKTSEIGNLGKFGKRPFADVMDSGHIARMLSRFLDRLRRNAKQQTALEHLEAGRAVEPADRDLSRVVPIILPLELLTSAWPRPIVQIGDLPFCAAWATCGEMNTFFYVTEHEAQFWEDAGIDWRSTALANLARISENRPASGEKLDEDGLPFLKVMLHEDAVGPSRLLLPHLFDEILGADYEVAMPEQTCAIAYRKNLSPDQEADVNGVINGCYEHGTEPVSAERFKADRFWEFAKGHHFSKWRQSSPTIL